MSDETKLDAVYIVQVLADRGRLTEDNAVEADLVWTDIATVSAPWRSTRKKVIGLALAQSGLRPGEKVLRLRVLDAASAHETEIAPFQPDAEWRIG